MPQCSVRKFCKAENWFVDIQLLGGVCTHERIKTRGAEAPRRPGKVADF